MNIEDYHYHLPDELIAQTPLSDRTSSKLMILDQDTDEIIHDMFFNIKSYFKKGDCLVLNNSRVIPVRLFGTKKDTKAKIEILLLHELEDDKWEALVKPAKRIKVGAEIIFGDGKLIATCVEEKQEGARILQLKYKGLFLEVLNELGEMPLPPYIKAQLKDEQRYQTVYAKEDGSAAAPTAGLHFTKELLTYIKQLGVHIVYITLHVGLGTFRPISVENIKEHHMHAEYYHVSKEVAAIINKVKANNGNIIAVGTTSTRVLETVAGESESNCLTASSGWTDIYIYPPYDFKVVDGLITNFHLPKSTLLLLISAFVGREKILGAYEEAINHNYRFFSFGDAMFILPKKDGNGWR